MLDSAFFKESNLSYFNISSESNKKSSSAKHLDESFVALDGKKRIEAEQ